jgi:hypothetical protein
MSADTKAAPAKTAAELCKRFPLSEDAAKLLRDGMEPRPYLDLLIEKQHHADAVRLLAHSMPKREAMWWACLCSRPEAGAAVPPPVAAAQKAAEDWITAPNDEKRRAAHVAAQAAGVGTPAGLTCEAVFFSEGSLGPPQYQAVPPPEHLAATTAANAIILAAVADPAKMVAKYGRFLALGKDVAAGKNRWK